MLGACGGHPPDHLGVQDGQLAPCPDSPNCVSSQAKDAEHRVAPLALPGSPQQTKARLIALLDQEPRARLVAQEDRYLRAEFSSRWLRFVDDVEFLIGEQAVEVRSASRLGYSDFGVNRRRIERLRRHLAEPP
ncbi:DUF1499 domain-containing protein [Pseudomonas benzenivorans]|uniref:DUF1499 domain-containing protein n=1 Tax=Pseudomonas benzenivorans TaxID=556533 RepID=A0ABZ0PR94_9PSED|nr:DUF1499 domain-containing protein [Pseudomonas benzenivorans]WPC03688.1 DUF1499 domain-containing protein [Pseudomonas benzenivorans]